MDGRRVHRGATCTGSYPCARAKEGTRDERGSLKEKLVLVVAVVVVKETEVSKQAHQSLSPRSSLLLTVVALSLSKHAPGTGSLGRNTSSNVPSLPAAPAAMLSAAGPSGRLPSLVAATQRAADQWHTQHRAPFSALQEARMAAGAHRRRMALAQALAPAARHASTSSPGSSPSPSPSPPPPPQSAQSQPPPSSSPSSTGKPKSKHKLVYGEVWPPLIRVLAYGSGVYFALHLVQQYLDGEEQRKLEADVRAELEAQVRADMAKRAVEGRTGKGSGNAASGDSKGWWAWISGSG